MHQPPLWHSAITLFAYAYPWSWLIRRWKFQEESHWAGWIASQLRSHPSLTSLLAQSDWVVPMASHAQRVRERGYDPVAQLARCWVPADKRLDALLPPVLAPIQHRLNRRERFRQTSGWSCRPEVAAQLQGRRVLLLDDVLTTGATATAATQALLQAGARAVHLVVVARTE